MSSPHIKCKYSVLYCDPVRKYAGDNSVSVTSPRPREGLPALPCYLSRSSTFIPSTSVFTGSRLAPLFSLSYHIGSSHRHPQLLRKLGRRRGPNLPIISSENKFISVGQLESNAWDSQPPAILFHHPTTQAELAFTVWYSLLMNWPI